MSGRIGDLSAKQAETLTQFRENVKDVLKPHFDDAYLLRWLRARSFDLKKAEKMLRESLKWREKNQVDTITETWTPPEALVKYMPGGVCGYDKEGFPVWVNNVGDVDIKGLFYSASKSDILKFNIWRFEKIMKTCEEQTKKLGKSIDGLTIISDMSGMGMQFLWRPAMSANTEIMAMFEANYPEIMKLNLVINAPKIFPIMFNIMKPFLSEETKQKIRLLGSDWKDEFLKHIDADQLPKQWGGTMVGEDEDLCCKHLVGTGGEVPKSYYLQKGNLEDMSKFTIMTIAAGQCTHVEAEVTEKGSIVQWSFWTESHDIGFGVFRKTSANLQKLAEMDEIRAVQRANSHLVPEDGCITCEKPGTYLLFFDNAYSLVNAKKVSYNFEVLVSDDMSGLQGADTFMQELTIAE